MLRPSLVPSALLVALSVTAAQAIPVDPPRTLSSYALFALDDLRTKGLEVTSGAVGVNAGMIYAHGPVRAPGLPVVADVVRIHEGSMCGALYGNTVVRAGADCGPGQPFLSPILADPAADCGVPAVFPACDANQPIVVPGGTTRHLAPGTYGAVVVDGGSVSGTLLLDGGAYTFCSLELGRNGELRTDAPATVAIAGRITVGPHTIVGPAAGSGLPPSALRLLSNDNAVRFARQSEVHATVCAPDALLRVTAGSSLDGLFMARKIHTEHITVHGSGRDTPRDTTTTTTTVVGSTSTSTTTLPGGPTTTAPTTTTTTAPGSTTTTTDPCLGQQHCGDGVLNCGEVCDPALPVPCDANDPGGAAIACTNSCSVADDSQCPPSSTTTTTKPGLPTTSSTTTTVASTTTTTLCPGGLCPQVVAEDCGNCTDDDGDGLIDFEDPDCCGTAPVSTAILHRGRMMPRPGNTSRLVLRATAGMMPAYTPHPMQQDVTLQIRSKSTGDELFCARMPAMKFMMRGKNKRKVGFWDYQHHVATARGVDDMTFRYRKNGQVRIRTLGRRAQFSATASDTFMITIGVRDPHDAAQNLCSAVVQPFTAHRSRSGKVKSLW